MPRKCAHPSQILCTLELVFHSIMLFHVVSYTYDSTIDIGPTYIYVYKTDSTRDKYTLIPLSLSNGLFVCTF